MQRFSFTQTQHNGTTENDIGSLEETHLIIELYLNTIYTVNYEAAPQLDT